MHTSLCFTISIDPRSVSCYAVACHHHGAAVVATPFPVPTTRCLLPTQRGKTPPLHRRHTPVAGTADLTVLHHFNRSPFCFLLRSCLPSPRGCCSRHAIPSAHNALPAAHTTRKDPPTSPPPHPRCQHCRPHCASPFQSIPVLFLATQSPVITAGLLWPTHYPQYTQRAACCSHNAERPPHSTAATPPLPALQTSLCFTILIDLHSVSC